MRPLRWLALGGLAASMAFASACRGLTGLDDLEFEAASGDADAGSVGSVGGVGGGQGGAGGEGGGPGGGGAGGGGSPCLMSNSECPTVLIPDTGVQVNLLAVDDDRLYFAHEGAIGSAKSSIYSAQKSGGEIKLLASGRSPARMVVDPIDKLLFWIDRDVANGQILAMASDGSSSDIFLIMSEAYLFGSLAIGTSSQALFYTAPSAGLIGRVESALNPSSSAVLYTYAAALETALDIEGDTLYWSESNTIRRLNDAGSGSPKLDAAIAIGGSPHDLDAAWGNVFYTLRTDSGSVMYVAEGTQVVFPFADAQAFPSHILVTETAVYWVNDGDAGCAEGKASVWRKGLSLDKPVMVAAGLPCPSNLAQDAAYVYWGAGNQIYRSPKPAP